MTIKTPLLILCALLCGCRREPLVDSIHDQNMSNVTAMRKEMADLVAKQNAELAFLAGWDSGFGICKDIKEGRLTNKESAMARAFQERTNYLGTNIP